MKGVWIRAIGFGLVAISALILSFGCSSSDNGTGTDDGGNPTASDSIVEVANDSLSTLIDDLVNNPDSVFRPDNVDFTGLYDLYREAYDSNPANNDARFGVAFCGIMTFLANQTFNDIYDDLKNQFDTGSGPFDPVVIYTPGQQELMGNSVPLAPSGFAGIIPDLVGIDAVLKGIPTVDSSIAKMQEVIEDSLLPLLQEAYTHLDAITGNLAYTFIITPEMQGNPGADSIIVDRSDFLVFQAAVAGFRSVLHMLISRTLDIDIFSLASIENALNQGNGILVLRPGNHLPLAKTRFLEALTDLEAAIASLSAEIGTNQDNDLIQIYADDQNDLNDVQEVIDSVQHYFSGAQTVTIDPGGPDEYSTTINVSQLFDNPVNDLKSILPGYTLTLEEVPDLYKLFADQHYSRARYWFLMDSLYGIQYPDDTTMFPVHMPDDSTSDDFYQVIAMEVTYANRSILLGWSDFDPVFEYSPRQHYEYRVFYDNPTGVEACFTWDANSWAEWIWPNPTMGGVLPDLTSDEIKSFIPDYEADWIKSTCDTLIEEDTEEMLELILDLLDFD